MMNRKEFLKTLGWGSFVLTASPTLKSCTTHTEHISPSSTAITEGLFETQLPSLSSFKNNIALEAKKNIVSILKDKKTNVLGYNNGILGPIFNVNSGENIKLDFKNSFFEVTNLHWHGLLIPANQDGHPENIIQPNQLKRFEFIVNQRASMAWYHPHPHGSTAEQTYLGLAGLFIVRDNEEKQLNLPSGIFEIPLIIQDKRIDSNGNLSYAPSMNDIMNGYLGDKITVNGVFAPMHEVSTKIYRLRILNASNARVYNLAFSNDAEFAVIGSDGGLLANTVWTKNLILSPGERIDVLVDFGSVELNKDFFLVSKSFSGSLSQGSESFKIMKFKVTKIETENFKIPAQLSNFRRLSSSLATKTRKFNISNAGHSMGKKHQINEKVFDINRIDERVNAGSYEIWEIDNLQGDEIHPMHIHGAFFQILERSGRALQANEMGWKDTVLLMPKEKASILIQFPENKGKFLFHCHNLEHEDDGMMLNYEII